MPFRISVAMTILDNQTWAQQQFANAELGDTRRTKRLGEIASSMLDAPDQSLPQQNPKWGDLKAAYRFFDCGDVTLKRSLPATLATNTASQARTLFAD